MQRYFNNNIVDHHFVLNNDDSYHIERVMRMQLNDVIQYMTDLGYKVEVNKEKKTYEGKKINQTILLIEKDVINAKSKIWYHFENRSGDIYSGDWTWYLNAKAWNSQGEYEVFEDEYEFLNQMNFEKFINMVEKYIKE